LDVLLVRHTVGSESTKLSVYKFFATVVENCSMHDLLQLVKIGMMEVLMEGAKSNHSVESIQTSLQALKHILNHTSTNCMM